MRICKVCVALPAAAAAQLPQTCREARCRRRGATSQLHVALPASAAGSIDLEVEGGDAGGSGVLIRRQTRHKGSEAVLKALHVAVPLRLEVPPHRAPVLLVVLQQQLQQSML